MSLQGCPVGPHSERSGTPLHDGPCPSFEQACDHPVRLGSYAAPCGAPVRGAACAMGHSSPEAQQALAAEVPQSYPAPGVYTADQLGPIPGDATGPHPDARPIEELDPVRRAASVAHLHDADLAIEGVRALLRLAGEDPDRDGLLDTPKRYVKAWRELTGRPGEPALLLARQFTDDDLVSDEMVCIGPMRFTSLCEHHLLPFTGTAWLAYVPTEGVVGLSKVPRLVEHFARRPQVQERLTAQIAETFERHVPALGVGVLLSAVHSCASMRGVRNEAPMTTSSLRGIFREDERTRAEFLALARR